MVSLKVALERNFSTNVKEQPAPLQLQEFVLGGLGYSGIGYKTSGVKALKLSDDEGGYFEPTAENCLIGDYPRSYTLHILQSCTHKN